MDNGFKKYAVIEYDGLNEDINFYFFETDVEKWSEEFNQILEDYEGNFSNLIVIDFDKFDKFKDAIKMTVEPKFEKITLESLDSD